ncbi:lysosomal acid phosphatase-like [Adelges cooleyi]|uniref:lysosomal acid phosphatase-like n=1 Tax=Adelges cooleyi TaxID=133065 RepID=UPI0021803435|nr:lysosomal acid phosphatase-like [Adelges cooleyi]
MSLNYNNMFLITIYFMVIATAIYGQIPKADSSLKFATVLFRHGERAPMITYNTDPHKDAFPEGLNELTKLGKQHMYYKGQIFRHIYGDYFSKLYLDNEIYTKTTNVARTHMTAAMVLTGLYPPTNYQKWSNQETLWQPIPVYGGSPDHSDSQVENCPSFMPTFIKGASLTENATLALEPLLVYLSEKCGQPIDSINVTMLFDLFTCQLAAGLELPEWTKPNIYEKLKAILYSDDFRRNFNGNTKLQNLMIGPLLNEITLKIQQKSSGEEKRKMYMYSGHDFSIMLLTAAVSGHLIETPKFGASLHFHVYRFNNTDEDVIKVYYLKNWDDDKGEELSVSNCNSPCKVADFINIANNKFTKTWEEECHT